MWTKGEHGYFTGSTSEGGGKAGSIPKRALGQKLQRRHYNVMAGAIAAAIKGDAARTKSIIEDSKVSKFTKAQREITKKYVGHVLKASDKNRAIREVAESLRGTNKKYDPERFAKAAKGESDKARDQIPRKQWKSEDIGKPRGMGAATANAFHEADMIERGGVPLSPSHAMTKEHLRQVKLNQKDEAQNRMNQEFRAGAIAARHSWQKVPGEISITNKEDNRQWASQVDRAIKEHTKLRREVPDTVRVPRARPVAPPPIKADAPAPKSEGQARMDREFRAGAMNTRHSWQGVAGEVSITHAEDNRQLSDRLDRVIEEHKNLRRLGRR